MAGNPRLISKTRRQQTTNELSQTSAEQNQRYTQRQAKPIPVVSPINEDADRSINATGSVTGRIRTVSQQITERSNINSSTFGASRTDLDFEDALQSNDIVAFARAAGITTEEAARVIIAQVEEPIPNIENEETRTPETARDISETLRGVSFESNALSQYDNITYNFRFFMAPEGATEESLSLDDIIIIAESGASGFYITDAKINTIISPNSVTKNAFATQIQFTIVEPHGNTLFDRIRNAGAELGIYDHREIPLWLQLSFKGYTSGGDNSHDGGQPVELDNEVRLWQVRVRGVDVEITKGGTEYQFNCVPFNEYGMQDFSRRLERNIQITATTLGDFFQKLAAELNKDENYSTRRSKDLTRRTKKFAFSFPKEQILQQQLNQIQNVSGNGRRDSVSLVKPMQEWKIRGSNLGENKRSESFKAVEESDGRWNITFTSGTSIEAIIQEVIGSTDEGQSYAIYGEPGHNITDIKPNEERNPRSPSIVFTTDPVVDITSYNGIAKAYNVLVTYHIRPYRSFQAVVSRKHIEDSQKGQSAKDRFNSQLILSDIRRKYEYMFTGQNTEVLDYKIRFDRAWFLSLPLYQGQNRTALGISSGNMTQQTKTDLSIVQNIEASNEAIQSLQTRIKEAQKQLVEDQRLNRLDPENVRTRSLQIHSMEQELSLRQSEHSSIARREQFARERLQRAANIPIEERRVDSSSFGAGRLIRLENDFEPRTGSNIDLFNGPDRDRFIVDSGAEDDRRIISERLTRSKSSTNTDARGSIFFVEDFDERSVGRDISKDQLREIIDVGTEISPTMVSFEGNLEGTSGKGRSFFSAIMNQIYGIKGQMISLDLEIRGDPYWLGESNPRKRIESFSNKDLTKSDSLLLLTFNFPSNLGDGGPQDSEDSYAGTGLYNLEAKENGFNGLYYIRQVESTFSNGRFTQKLIGHADPLTQEINVIKAAKSTNFVDFT